MTDPITTALNLAADGHRGGHYCKQASGNWRNPGIPGNPPCPVITVADTALAALAVEREAVHNAAHDTTTVDVVASAMLSDTPLTDLDPGAADGWRYLARAAIEALAAHLDPGVE